MTQKALKEIGQTILQEHGIKGKIKFKNINGGRATKLGNISIPKWTLTRGKRGKKEYFALYYVLHEVSHLIQIDRGLKGVHTNEFKEIEKALMLRYNIIPIYSKAYPKKLINKEGKTLYERG